ncbi:MAG: MAPEG family protein [Myxococcales bacterium]|nr:MAPEG family protein [Myxococcales bacterium]
MTTLTVWIGAGFILFLKMLALSFVQAFYRVRYRRYTRADDAKFFGKGAEVSTSEHPVSERAGNAWRNDLENIPMFLILALGHVMAGASLTMVSVFCGAFVAARVTHTLAYLRPTQPLRNIAYQLGILSILGVGIHALILSLAQ